MFWIYFLAVSLLLLETTRQDSDVERYITTLNYTKIKTKPVKLYGTLAKRGMMPYLVSMKTAIKFNKNSITWRNICGGSIINPNEVVTAAHCFEADDFFFVKYPQLLRIVAGYLASFIEVTLPDYAGQYTQWRYVSKINIHKDYYYPMNDIALVVVNESFLFNDEVNSIDMATKTEDDLKNCVVAGFGPNPVRRHRGLNAGSSEVLIAGDVRLISREHCSILWEINMDNFICSNSILPKTVIAEGVSGGPLVCEDIVPGSLVPHGDHLSGISCGKNYDGTTLFTRISAYQDFIKHRTPKTQRHTFTSSLKNASQRIKCACISLVLFFMYCTM